MAWTVKFFKTQRTQTELLKESTQREYVLESVITKVIILRRRYKNIVNNYHINLRIVIHFHQ